MKLRTPALFFALAACLTCLAAQPAQANDPRTRGALAFSENGCTRCHAIRHNGGTKGPDLSGVGRRRSDAQIRTQIIEGGKQMPPFGDVLQDSELDDLVTYLHSCRDKTKK
ncbi:c-type cytochrome [Edaphobacter bradus]|uniref:c-type cytochrome n=1 Tax=Edaphobacter bradus TaxID=2259016 RepID=UPI0021DFD113|nr:cytochrome c [Edaphobacter bradus]